MVPYDHSYALESPAIAPEALLCTIEQGMGCPEPNISIAGGQGVEARVREADVSLPANGRAKSSS